MAEKRAEIGIFGGSGFYSFIEHVEEISVETPYGAPSDKVALGDIGGRRVAFLPRHGRNHQYPPHMINYRANMYAMKSLGVEQVVGPCASGSLQPEIKPGMFVLCDQFIDRTSGRKDTFYDGPVTTHVSASDPYCEVMRDTAYATAKELGISIINGGTVVVIQGPRFSTRSESKWFSSMGWEVINMTQYPEAYLARELEMCYLSVALITDYDVGLEGIPEIPPVTHEEVVKVFMENNDKLRDLLMALVPKLPDVRSCGCYNALEGARF